MQRKTDNIEDSKNKERHIVTWSHEEDDVLREQISLHGTDNWTIIASNFKDKTTRQCRRRWYTYLNSDFKKGGWSPEEDLLLCEAQRIYGNRWTEIAKVVSGRTDNAVKNRFTTLCKKRAKYDALAKENHSSYINPIDKMVIGHEPAVFTNLKRMRMAQIPGELESRVFVDQQLRTPFAVLDQNVHDNRLVSRYKIGNKGIDVPASSSNKEGTFLKKDDPKVAALMQQSELLSSLAVQVNTESTDRSFENAWKVLRDFLNQRKDGKTSSHRLPDTDYSRQDFKELLEDIVKRSSNTESRELWREEPDIPEESRTSSECSTGSTIRVKTVNDISRRTLSSVAGENHVPHECENTICSAAVTDQETSRTCDAQVEGDIISVLSSSFAEFGSPPRQLTLVFRSMGAGIPSPKFSESERNFLLKALGMDYSPSSAISSIDDTSRPPPPCKRALLQSP